MSNTAIVILDAFALLALIFTVLILAGKGQRILTRDQLWILAGILGLRLFRDICNLLEWTGIYPALEDFEDYPGLLEPLFWGFLFYSFVQNRIQRSLDEERAKYRFLAESMSDVLWSAGLDGRFTYISPSVERLQGWTAEEISALSAYEQLTPAARQLALKTLGNELAMDTHPGVDPDRHVYLELEQFCKDGSTVWTEISVSFIRDDNGMPIGLTGVTRDISERVRADRERQRLEAQLRQTQKLEAIGVLAGGIAHDFNNVLFGILGFSDLALTTLPKSHEALQYLREIRIAAHRAADLVRQILTFARRSDRTVSPVDLAPLVKEVAKMMSTVLPAGIEVMQRLPAGSCVINADPTEIHQVLLNLCTNAGHALQENGGILEIGLQRTTIQPDATPPDPGLAPGHYVLLRVQDNGVGIPAQIVDRIFEPFFTTKDKDEGTGMGLSTVKGIVDELGGVITVSSAPGQGTTFNVYLPESTGEKRDAPMVETSLPRGNERIAVVDDEPTLATMVSLILESLGYRVTTFTDSREALAVCRADPRRFDLVITDQSMPGLTGRELTAELAEVRPDLPVVICTGYSPTVRDRHQTNDLAAAYVFKPITTQELAEVVRSVLDR